MKNRILLLVIALSAMLVAAEDAELTSQQATSPRLQAPSSESDAVTIPRMLSYQGKLTDTMGIPVPNGNYSVVFRLYTQPSGGSAFWNETQSVGTNNGLFSVPLGSVTPIGSMPDAGTAYLGMAVGGGSELTPRLRIASAAYAYLSERAANADLLQGRDTTTFSRSAHNHDATYVNEGQASSVTSTMITDATVAAADLNQMGASSGQVMKWTGSVWAPRNDSVGSGGGDNAWVRGTPDSVLFTVRQLGVARGDAGNDLQGGHRYTHVNLGTSSVTGASGADHAFCTVGGGFGNTASGSEATVSGGWSNAASGYRSTVAGGASNTAGAQAATVGGGVSNYVSGFSGTVAGGESNTVEAHHGGTLSGYGNSAGDDADDSAAVVSGGYDNEATGRYSFVGGGRANIADGLAGTVAGGDVNSATGAYATVSGGSANVASGLSSAVCGGASDTASGAYALVGGILNTASGLASAVPGGAGNAARGYSSSAGGCNARANHDGCFVWSDALNGLYDSLYSTATCQWRVRAKGGTWFFSNQAMTTGVVLGSGSNSWGSVCDSMNKEDFRPVDRAALLDKVASLRVRNYKMKDQNDGTRHIGPVAQDFQAAFGVGEDNKSINMADADGVLLAAVQALYEQNQELTRRVAELEAGRSDR